MRGAKSLVLAMPLWLMACVTINVYFPAAAAEKAADRFTREVYGEPPAGEQKPPAKSDTEPRSALDRLLVGTLDLLVPSAQAAADINLSTPATRAIKAAMKERQAALRPYYQSGAVGIDRRGLLVIR